MALRVLFFGTPVFAVPTLERLVATKHHVVGVVTQPDRPRGRGHRVTPSPAKTVALRQGIQVFQPEKLRDATFLAQMRSLDADLGVVAAYGRILPQELLDLPRLGLINVHASLLPRWRGAAPVHRAILSGDRSTGVSIMRVVRALDAGPVLTRSEVAIAENETSQELETRLSILGADLLATVADRLDEGPVPEEPQDERLVTYAPRLERDEGRVDWSRPAQEVHDRIRGLQPWPQVAALLNGRRVLLRRSTVASREGLEMHQAPGTILAVESDALRIATGAGAVRLLEIQPEGRPPMSVRAFVSGHPVRAGDRFEQIDPHA